MNWSRFCVVTSGVVLMLCGILCGCVCGYYYQWIPELISTACGDVSSSQGGCLSISSSRCKKQLKEEAGCKCQSSDLDCDCKGSLTGMLIDYWTVAMIGMGVGGLLSCCILTGIPAIKSSMTRAKNCCSVFAFSTMCAILSIPFLAIGGAFGLIAIWAHRPGPVAEFAGASNCMRGHPSIGGITFGTASVSLVTPTTCGNVALCSFVRELMRNVQTVCATIAAPFVLAGLCMLVGAFACCLCRRGLPGRGDVEDEESHWKGTVVGDEGGWNSLGQKRTAGFALPAQARFSTGGKMQSFDRSSLAKQAKKDKPIEGISE